jgi:hypothetical protein
MGGYWKDKPLFPLIFFERAKYASLSRDMLDYQVCPNFIIPLYF